MSPKIKKAVTTALMIVGGLLLFASFKRASQTSQQSGGSTSTWKAFIADVKASVGLNQMV